MGISFDKREPYFRGAQNQSSNAISSNAIAGQMRYVRFWKTLTMNVVGAALWGIAGFALFFQKLGEQPFSILVAIVITYIIIVGVPTGTAIALSRRGESGLCTIMIWLNFALIALGVMSCAMAVYFGFQPLNFILFPFVFLVPEILNISALRKKSRMLVIGRGARS